MFGTIYGIKILYRKVMPPVLWRAVRWHQKEFPMDNNIIGYTLISRGMLQIVGKVAVRDYRSLAFWVVEE